jgi:hypothetical protein
MNQLLIVGILIFSTVPLYAQNQQPDVTKLKVKAQKVVSIIKGDKTKTQAYLYQKRTLDQTLLQPSHFE